MKSHRRRLTKVFVAAVVLVTAALAVAAGQYDWLPAGGATLLQRLLPAKASGSEVAQLLGTQRTANAWTDYLGKTYSQAFTGMTKPEQETLTSYLATNAPISSQDSKKLQGATTSSAWSKLLPQDGKLLVEYHCGLCHSLGTSATTSRSVTAWSTLLHVGQMANIGLTDNQIQTLVGYLAANMPVPANTIPAGMNQAKAGY